MRGRRCMVKALRVDDGWSFVSVGDEWQKSVMFNA